MRNSGLALLALFVALSAPAQQVREVSTPLGSALDKALETSLLTGPHAQPFHLKAHLFETTNPECGYCADIEEYWVSPTQWRRTIVSPNFTLTIVTNGHKVSEQSTGGYFPLWLKRFVTGIFELVPNPELWSRTDAKITQIILPDGRRSDACARLKTHVGSAGAQNDAFSNVCFDGDSHLKFVGSPGYDMEFHDYKKFGKLNVARRYVDHPEPGTELVANLTTLEELKHTDPSQFEVAQASASADRITSLQVPQDLIDSNAVSGPPLKWPKVQSGKTSGVLSMYISVDRAGKIREAYPLNADNAGLQDTARDQLLTWQLKPFLKSGAPIQVEAAMTFRFDTTIDQPAAEAAAAERAKLPHYPEAIAVAKLLSQVQPQYPAEAREKHIHGQVVLGITIDVNGIPKDFRVLSSPDDSLTKAAIEAAQQWRYRPYIQGHVPVEGMTEVKVNFGQP